MFTLRFKNALVQVSGLLQYIRSHVTGGLCGERHNKARERARDTEEVRKKEF